MAVTETKVENLEGWVPSIDQKLDKISADVAVLKDRSSTAKKDGAKAGAASAGALGALGAGIAAVLHKLGWL